jgi:hypothetical protein
LFFYQGKQYTREGVFSGVACIPCFCGVLDGRMAGEEQTTSSSFPEYPLLKYSNNIHV